MGGGKADVRESERNIEKEKEVGLRANEKEEENILDRNDASTPRGGKTSIVSWERTTFSSPFIVIHAFGD